MNVPYLISSKNLKEADEIYSIGLINTAINETFRAYCTPKVIIEPTQ